MSFCHLSTAANCTLQLLVMRHVQLLSHFSSNFFLETSGIVYYLYPIVVLCSAHTSMCFVKVGMCDYATDD
jgi:hypothetical protein